MSDKRKIEPIEAWALIDDDSPASAVHVMGSEEEARKEALSDACLFDDPCDPGPQLSFEIMHAAMARALEVIE